MHAAGRERPEIAAARAAWRAQCPLWEARSLIVLDETGLNTKMTRLHGHRRTAAFIAAPRPDRLCAPWHFDAPVDGVLFGTYIEQVLAPELRPGDLVICDNLSGHKVTGIAQTIEKCGARLLYLLAYSPDLNPIEMAFAKLRAALRSVAQTSCEGLLSALAAARDSFSPFHCQIFFLHASYAIN